jgi:homoserine O-succinyltransferase
MAIKLPNGLAAADRLRSEGETVLPEGAAVPGRVLRIGLLNLMPSKEATELAFTRLLAQGPWTVDLTLIVPSSYRPKNVPAEHIERFYRRWPEVRDARFDGLIVTGAPVEILAFEDVAYWSELREIMAWAKANVRTTLYVCWAAQAALHAFRGIPKHLLPQKAFGVFEQQVTVPASPLLKGLGSAFPVPVSRHTAVAEEALAEAGLRPLARSAATGACIVDDAENRAVCIFDHLEYEADTLQLEFERDIRMGKAIAPPHGTTGEWRWRPHAALFFRNWLDRAGDRDEDLDPGLAWLFSPERRARTQVVVQAEGRAHLLAEVLSRLAQADIDPAFARVLPWGASLTVIGIELDASQHGRVEEAGSLLAELSGVRRVLCRLPNGSGAVFRPNSARELLANAA